MNQLMTKLHKELDKNVLTYLLIKLLTYQFHIPLAANVHKMKPVHKCTGFILCTFHAVTCIHLQRACDEYHYRTTWPILRKGSVVVLHWNEFMIKLIY